MAEVDVGSQVQALLKPIEPAVAEAYIKQVSRLSEDVQSCDSIVPESLPPCSSSSILRSWQLYLIICLGSCSSFKAWERKSMCVTRQTAKAEASSLPR